MTTPRPREEGWPEPDAPTVEQTRETLVAPGGPPPPDRRIGAGMLLALGAIALVALGFLVTYLVLHRDKHTNPPTTVVVTTAAGTSTGGALIAVPDLRGIRAANAESALKSVGLTARTTTVAAAGRPAGTVLSESPQQGAKVAKGSEVLLTVAGAAPARTSTAASTAATTTAPPQPATSTVPDLSGLDEAGAAQALGDAGLLASLAFVPSDDPLGTVEAQGKAAGSTVPYHAHVQVNVAIGPGTKPNEAVPDVVGKALREAVDAVNAAHLRLIYLKLPVGSKAQAGEIVQQTPLGGAHAPQNAQVIVYLAVFRPGR